MKDTFDREIQPGDLVAYGMRSGDNGALGIYRVVSINPPKAIKLKYSGWSEPSGKVAKMEFIPERACIISKEGLPCA